MERVSLVILRTPTASFSIAQRERERTQERTLRSLEKKQTVKDYRAVPETITRGCDDVIETAIPTRRMKISTYRDEGLLAEMVGPFNPKFGGIPNTAG